MCAPGLAAQVCTVLVTTDKRGSYQPQAERLVGELAAAGQPARLVERHAGSTLSKLLDANPDAEALLVVDERATLRMRDGAETRLHGGIGVLRLRHLAKGGSDAMVEACGLQAGETFVDCTAGECHDAIVAAWVVGMDGCVIGMEASPLIYAVASVRPLRSGDSQMDNLVDRISMRLGDHTKLLAAMPSASADVVYFAPMCEAALDSCYPCPLYCTVAARLVGTSIRASQQASTACCAALRTTCHFPRRHCMRPGALRAAAS